MNYRSWSMVITKIKAS